MVDEKIKALYPLGVFTGKSFEEYERLHDEFLTRKISEYYDAHPAEREALINSSKKKFIAVTCQYDVVDWLDPDWVFCTDTMEFDQKKEVGRPLNSKFIGAAQVFGRYFGNIII